MRRTDPSTWKVRALGPGNAHRDSSLGAHYNTTVTFTFFVSLFIALQEFQTIQLIASFSFQTHLPKPNNKTMKFSLQTLVAAVTVSSTSATWGYWVPPLDEPGVSCEHKRIKIPDHGEYTCMVVGTGICRNNGGYFGEWRFGVNEFEEDDPAAGQCYYVQGDIPGVPENCADGGATTFPTILSV